MLLPKRTKYRRPHRIKYEGKAKGNTKVDFGEFGLQSLDGAWITNRQIEAARIAMTRYMKRWGKVWIRIFPHMAKTKKPLEVRMGSGKGSPEEWVAVVKTGTVMFEVAGVSEEMRKEKSKMNDLNKKLVEELKKMEEESRAELFALRFQSAMGNLEKPHRIGELKKQIARILTVLSSRKKDGENTAINVKFNLSETYAKIEKESQEFAKQRKAKIDQILAEQEGSEDNMASLMDLPLTDAIELTKEAPDLEISAKADDKKPAAVKKEPAKPAGTKDTALKSLIKKNETAKAASKPAAPTTSSKSTVTVKSVTSAKAEIEMPKVTKKTTGTNTTKKDVELNAKEKLAAMKSSISIGTAKGRGTGVKINLDLKTKDPKASEYTYGTNWKENCNKILTAGKTIKKPMIKQLPKRKRQGKNNGKK